MDKKIKVLMVDDEAQFRTTTNRILTRRGFDTIMAENGEQAIEQLVENPDVIILDIKMPGMDGHQTLAEIRKTHPDLPVIMLTGHGDLKSARQARGQGAFDYLSKPCNIDVLAGKIKDAVYKKTASHADEEKTVAGVMVPISEYTTLPEDAKIRDAIFALKQSFYSKMATSMIMETGHRSVLVMDNQNKCSGLVEIIDLMDMIMPAYLSAPKPSLADTIAYSPMFWKGMFTTEIKKKSALPITEVMSAAPYAIDGTASLMEACYMMLQHKVRRLVVMQGGKIAGVIREQDLFFEMEKILKD